jgi:hypothetical protein
MTTTGPVTGPATAPVARTPTRAERVFGLDDEGWARHANPWSVYTRIPIPALFAGAVWSRARIGRWSLVPVGAVCAWAWINPRAFPPPRSLDSWASKAVLGEPYWTNREAVPVPPRHRVAPKVLLGLNTAGALVLARGLVARDGWMTLCGLAVHMAGKNWFLDRMAILHDDVVPPGTDERRPAA